MSALDSVNSLFNNAGIRKFFVKLRLPLGLAALVGFAYWADPAWFWRGLAVSAFGACFQWWCFSCIMTSQELALRGPYMCMRNPMYIARLFLVLGVVLMTGNLYLTGAVAVLYVLYMVNRVGREEKKLRKLFGAPYEAYCRDVPRYVPGFKRFNPRHLLWFDPRCFRRNHGVSNMIAVGAAYALLYAIVFHARG